MGDKERLSLTRYIKPAQRRRDLEEIADNLSERGIPFTRVPDEIYPGMPYITPKTLVDSGATRYSWRHILLLMRRREISGAHYIARTALLDPEGVLHLLKREQRSVEENVRAGGRMPGRKNRKKP